MRAGSAVDHPDLARLFSHRQPRVKSDYFRVCGTDGKPHARNFHLFAYCRCLSEWILEAMSLRNQTNAV
jgi:hypothetical protein